MKLKLSLLMPGGGLRDITLSCDVTTTAAEAARTLIQVGVSSEPRLVQIVRERLAPVTLRGRAGVGTSPVLFDPEIAVSASGIQSGWIIEPVPEFGDKQRGPGGGERAIEVLAHIEVLSGRQEGVQFSLVAGSNLIGRDIACRVHLVDTSVSRRHAAIDIDGGFRNDGSVAGLVLRDLGSANRVLVDGNEVKEQVILNQCNITLGNVELQITPGPTPPSSSAHSTHLKLPHRTLHMRSPRLAPHFAASSKSLPVPPSPSPPHRIPMLAMLAPVMLGVAMFAVTRSPMSLMMVAFSPMMMIGSWLDNRFGGARRLRRELRQFKEALGAERAELDAMRTREIEVRSAETPTLAEIANAVIERGDLLWARRPEHGSFLEVRFGDGSLPSRTEVRLPERGESVQAAWETLRGVEAEFQRVSPVPVLENLNICGSIGVAGESFWAEGLTRAVVLQLAGLHSPTELTIACFANSDQAPGWAWLKWLPHVDPVTSPLRGSQLAHDAATSTRLVNSIEDLLRVRQECSPSAAATSPVIAVIVLDDSKVDASRLIALAEAEPSLGVHVIWLGRTATSLPAACRTFVEVSERNARANFVRTGNTVELQRIEFVDQLMAHRLARTLASVEDASCRVLDESDLPKSVDLRELCDIDLLSGGHEILRAWQSTDSLSSTWQANTDRQPTSLSAVIGQGADGPVCLDLRSQGPHALVGGTTGSGKSEFLQTWIMSLASRISPERITFLLVDYKGGAAFAECTELPHTVGMVTDLTPHLVRRALTSLRAELRYREALLASHSAKDLISMERQSDPATPPVLVVVIDEFAALATDVPEFVDGVIDIAQRGRSLGLHLIMATQRPAGVINDNLRANTNLRVALRMADEAESFDVIGVKDAALFESSTPGRGAVKTGARKISNFQTGYLGSHADAGPQRSSIEVRSLDFAEGNPWILPFEVVAAERMAAKQPRDIEQLRDGILKATRLAGLVVPRRPWLNALPETLDLRELKDSLAFKDLNRESPVMGLRDKPGEQSQLPFVINLEDAGNVGILGASGTGKTTALLTLAASLSMDSERTPVQIYAIDAAGGALDALSVLPTVGAIAQLEDDELCGRILRRLSDLIGERGTRFAAARASSLTDYRRTGGTTSESRIVLLLDGFGAFRQTHEAVGGQGSPIQMLSEIMMKGRAVGVHVVLTSDRAAAIPSSMASTLQQRYVLRLADPHDYGYLGVNYEALVDAPSGRAILVGDSDELQFALIDGNPDFATQALALEELGAALRSRGVPESARVCNAPGLVRLPNLPVESRDRPVIGIDTRTFEAVSMAVSGLGVIAGPTGSGRSTALRCCVSAFERWAEQRGENLERILLTLNSDENRTGEEWDHISAGETEVRDTALRLLALLGSGLRTSENKPFQFQTRGVRGVIVVEGSAEAEGTDVMQALVALARAARRAEALVLFEFEQGGVGGNWELFSVLKRPKWGVALQPDERDGQSLFREGFGRVKQADSLPGRGFVVEAGAVIPVQIAVPGNLGEAPSSDLRLKAA